MNRTNKTLGKLFTLFLASSGLAAAGTALADTPRGQDVRPQAGNCEVGPFHQTMKAGEYNILCQEMSDAEKCLAFIKGQFDTEGGHQPFSDIHVEKAKYCMDALQKALLLGDI